MISHSTIFSASLSLSLESSTLQFFSYVFAYKAFVSWPLWRNESVCFCTVGFFLCFWVTGVVFSFVASKEIVLSFGAAANVDSGDVFFAVVCSHHRRVIATVNFECFMNRSCFVMWVVYEWELWNLEPISWFVQYGFIMINGPRPHSNTKPTTTIIFYSMLIWFCVLFF